MESKGFLWIRGRSKDGGLGHKRLQWVNGLEAWRYRRLRNLTAEILKT